MHTLFLAVFFAYASISVSSPVPHQVIQRTNGSAAIPIVATCAPGDPIRARFAGDWQHVGVCGDDGTFAGELPDQPAGSGALIVCSRDSCARVEPVGVGDVYIVAGQSNAAGSDSQVNHYNGGMASMLGESYNHYDWRDLEQRSVWPMLATLLLDSERVPVAFVMAAKPSTSAADWQPGGWLYRNMLDKARMAGQVKAVLWWQGEQDVFESTPGDLYRAQLNTIAAAVESDLGAPLVVAKLQTLAMDNTTVNAAIEQAWSDGKVVPGADLSGLTTAEGWHVRGEQLQEAARLWWEALEVGLYSR